ncbi:hypothetical protein SAMN05443572_1149 [Myxococcus fulvus]|uniref:Uncharacterized protein n=2 Tax=Myxococcus fulvus TaxID=33 RepID=A0A511TAG2_MYXFU|nr:hypothetical protein MFUL124B02_42485 [Myxococcus fulvus 124B02]GEN11159.1 hypothetical protein MFU01_61960 [Myxococcus fulvus]SEU39379.1 hypothetical protein SAMN05443572_1149 [Myxococcus fulvus]
MWLADKAIAPSLTGWGEGWDSGAMSEQGYPVTVAVRRPDGRVEQVRVGTAFRSEEGFTLRMGELSIGSTPDAASAAPRRSAPSAGGGGGGGDGMVFPNYGRSKGAPVAGASMQDLEFYANGARRSLNDPSKSRWHDKERQLLSAIEAEMARQQGGGGGNEGGGYGGGRGGGDSFGGRGGGGYQDDVPPPNDDDNIPF